MNELAPDEAQFLARARRGLSPTPASRERIAQGIASQLALATLPRAVPKPLDARVLRVARWVGVAGMVALGGAFGYFQGYRAGSKQREVITVVRSIPAVPTASVPTTAEPRALLEASPPSVANKAVRALIAAPSARASGEAVPPAAPLGLDEEVRQLRRVERAIRENNPRFALVLLDELDAAIPGGQLLEERKAASLMAECQLDASAAQDAASAFVMRNGKSAYVSRVRELCGLPAEVGKRISPTPGTSVPSKSGR